MPNPARPAPRRLAWRGLLLCAAAAAACCGDGVAPVPPLPPSGYTEENPLRLTAGAHITVSSWPADRDDESAVLDWADGSATPDARPASPPYDLARLYARLPDDAFPPDGWIPRPSASTSPTSRGATRAS